MNLKELVLKDMPEDLDNLGKARYVYLKLADYLNFSTKFTNTTIYERNEMHNKKIKSFKIKSNLITCNMWAGIYSNFLNEFGIENIIIGQWHEYVMFRYNNKWWIADGTDGAPSDLSRIRHGDKTEFFGVARYQNIDKPFPPSIAINDKDNLLLEKIDKKFDFYTQRRQNLLKLYEVMAKIKASKLPLPKRMELFYQTLGKLNDGYYETKDYVHCLTTDFLDISESKYVRGTELKRTNKNHEVDIVQCITVVNNNDYDYYLLVPNHEIKKVTKEDIIRLAVLGYGIGEKNIYGINYPKNFKIGVISQKGLSYCLKKNRKSIYNERQIRYK